MTAIVDVAINGRWTLKLPEHRAERHSWPWWEATRLACMHHYLHDGGLVVYDVGGEEGDFPALWASWGNEVVVFEPNLKVWPNIKAIFDANGLVPEATFPGFAADVDGERDVEFIGRREWSDVLWPTSAHGPVIGDHGFCNLSERPDIPRLTIDTVATIVEPPGAITIDVEGSELRVLHGAKQIITECRPLVWVSVHPQFMADMYGDSAAELHAFFDGLGYERTFLTADHEEHWFMWPAERELFVQ